VSQTKTDEEIVEAACTAALAKCYRTDPADRAHAEACARVVFGDDAKEYIWAEGFSTAADEVTRRGGLAYWLQSECDRSWITYYATGEMLSDIAWDAEDREMFALARAEEALLDSCFAALACADGTVILVERPTEYHVDELGRPHRIGGPDLAFRDGMGTYHWHGIRMPKAAMTDPHSITLEQIRLERNAEVRRALIALYGEGRWLLDTKAEPIDSDPRYGDLYRLESGELILLCSDGVPQLDGTSPKYTLRINAECRPMREGPGGVIVYGNPQPLTARNAAAASYGRRGDEYDPAIRT
jgi:hypothetical protein